MSAPFSAVCGPTVPHMDKMFNVIGGALDDVELVRGDKPDRWDQAEAVVAALTRFGYVITPPAAP